MKTPQSFIPLVLLFLISLATSGCGNKAPSDSNPISVDQPPVTIPENPVNSDRLILQPRCVKWDEFKQAVAAQRINLEQPIPDLPVNFSDGCVLADRGIYTLVLYVFMPGTDVKRLPISKQLPALYGDFYAIVPPVNPHFNMPDLPTDLRFKYMRIAFDSPNRFNSLDLNKPQEWKTWERPYAPDKTGVSYRTIFVESYYINTEEVTRLLEATKERWNSQFAITKPSPSTDDRSTCKLKDWNILDPYGEVTFHIAVTNRSQKQQTSLLVELEILDKEGNAIRMLSNPYRRYQGWTFDFDPSIRDGETREMEGFRKYMVGWHQVKLKRCQWLNPGQYRQLYPEINNTYSP
jgi:hypothetical protein